MTQTETPNLREQIKAQIREINPKTLADLRELKFKYRNHFNGDFIDEVALKMGYGRERRRKVLSNNV